MVWFVPGFLVHPVFWGQGCGGGCLGVFGVGHLPVLSSQRAPDPAASVCPDDWISHTWAGRCFCARSLHGRWLWERLARIAATILLLAQGRSSWGGWQPDVAARAMPTTLPRAPWSWMQSRLHTQLCYSSPGEDSGWWWAANIATTINFSVAVRPCASQGKEAAWNSPWVGCSSRQLRSSQTKPR